MSTRTPHPSAVSAACWAAASRVLGRACGPWVLAAAALLSSGGVAAAPPAASPGAAGSPSGGVALRLIGFNDFHGHLEAGNLSLTLADPAAPGRGLRVPVGGAAALAGMVNRLRDSAEHALVLSSGDLIGAAPLVSTLFHHESTIEVMGRIGIDLNVAGNHEFDAGLAELRRLYRGGCAGPSAQPAVTSCALDKHPGARFPLLAANVLDSAGRPVFAPYVIRRYQGIPVGVVGAVTRSTPSIVIPSGVAGLRFTDEAEAINRSVRELRRRGVKAIVAVLHEGGEVGPPNRRADWNDASCSEASGPIFEIAKRLDKTVDVVFSAHTHQGYRCEIGGRVVIQATSYGRGVSVVDLVLDPRTRDVDTRRTRSINLPVLNEATDAAVRDTLAGGTPEPYAALLRAQRPDTAIAARVAQYAAIVAPKAGEPVGRIGGRFTRAGPPGGRGDSAAGRLIADAQLAATRAPAFGAARIAFMNPGGIRTDLDCAAPPCTVSFGAAFNMQPFGNSLVVMSLTGAQLKALLEGQQPAGRNEPSFLQPSSGFSYEWHAGAPVGERVQAMRLDGAPIVATQAYRVTVNSFLAEGGDGQVLLKQGSARQGGAQDLDALLAHLKTEPPPAPQAEPRIRYLP